VRLLDALTVDHQHRDGLHVRSRRADGSLGARRGGTEWSRYRRALAVPNHGMQVLCFNCHNVQEITRSRRHLEAAG
jgi:hypothetical protein